ncbi:MAG: hypothetical protein JNM21_12350 [Taibaiella sp.]|nr:hypothetical protein [Taibaiella sp.]
MMIKKLIPIALVFLFSCNSEQIENSKVSQKDTIVQTNSKWEKQIISNYNEQFPEIYAYSIKWDNGDSLVTYNVISKYKDSLAPIELDNLIIKSKDISINVGFINIGYKENLPSFSYNFSDIDKKRIDYISIRPDSLDMKRNQKEREIFEDSLANQLFK